ncbi:hypothetical protein K9L97_02800 [Candidatus Woesearchaeota archaeon]|nr:hypothetical protein [Candidatus Woesearchaeota archaeon]
MKNKPNKKAQALTTDFIIGLLMFIFLLITAITIIVELTPNSNYETLYNNNIYISESLLTSGFPQNWNSTTAIIPGITTNQRINETKLAQFDNISYEKTKTLLHTESEYIFFFENQTGIMNISTKCTRGHPIQTDNDCTPQLEQINYDNLAKTERFTIYKSQIVKLTIYSWN